MESNAAWLKIKEKFECLRIEGWQLAGNVGKGGQAETIQVKHLDGQRGVFRILKNKNDTAIKRFYRELAILTNPAFRHKIRTC